VAVGARVAEGVGGVFVGDGAKVLDGVELGVTRTGLGVAVWLGMRVSDGLGVGVLVRVGEGVRLGTAVGGEPSTVKRPEVFQLLPTKTCTSYSPASHRYGSGFQSVYPIPPVPPSQGSVS
jgi:hypothetical protein